MIYFVGFLLLIIFQRVIELFIASNHRKIMVAEGAVEFDSEGYKIIVFMHILFFISTILEFFLLKRSLNEYWILLIVIFLLAQVLRYWAIISLGKFWNTRVLVLKVASIIKSGPYKFMKHPNYLAVIIEIAVIPLIFSCYVTAIVFSILNLFVLRRRINIEENALRFAID